MFDPKKLTPDVKKAFIEAKQSTLKFAENFLIDPTLKTPFKATYPQRFILSSEKRNVWICVHRRSGKCIVDSSLVIDPITLRPTPISKLEHAKKTLCFDFKENSVVWSEASWINSGFKKCIKLSLGSGSALSLSLDHQLFCSKKGWVQAKDLKVGDRILAPSSLPVFGNNVITQEDIESIILEMELTKTFPDLVFSLDKESLINFIREFFIERGRILHNQRCIVFMLWNRSISIDLKHLLLRLGIHARVDSHNNLYIDEQVDVNLFLNTLGFDTPVTEIHNARRWEIITDIVHIGTKPVYDLTVEHDDHNFIANDTVVHNSYSLTIKALWHAIMEDNKKIVVFAPSSTQINEFFDILDKWIGTNEFLSALQDPSGGNHKNPQKRTFVNGSTIQGYLMGLSGGLEGGRRGITADVVILDEAQEFDEQDWKVITPIMIGDRFRSNKIRCYIAGTINEPDNYYYEKIYKIPPTDSEDLIFVPIDKNKEYSPEEVENIRLATSPPIWTTEYLLQVGEKDAAVFRRNDILRASEEDWEYGPQNINHNKVRFIGVDWDKAQAGTNVAVFQYDPVWKSLEVIYREEVERSEFTYLNACSLIMDLYEAYQPELVITDQGQGEVQYEVLMQEAIRRNSGLASRLIKKAFQEKIEVISPETGEIEKKLLKPFLVGQFQQKMEQGKFKFPGHDEKLRNQLLTYEVKATTAMTIKYTSNNEHIIDCCLFALYGIWYLFENEFEERYQAGHNSVKKFTDPEKPNEFQEQAFWQGILGPRTNYLGPQVPRDTFDIKGADPFQKYRDFYMD